MTFPKTPTVFVAPQWLNLLLVILLGAAGWWWMGRSQLIAVNTMRTTRDLPAYTQLTTGDIITATSTTAIPGAITSMTEVIERFTTQPVAKDAVLMQESLQALPNSGQQWWVLTLPLSVTVVPAVGETVLLIGLDRSGQGAIDLSTQATVLGIEAEKVVVALPPGEARRTLFYLVGERRVFVVRRLH